MIKPSQHPPPPPQQQQRPLDLDAVEAFVRIAELGSFTRAADAMQITQAAVSLKLKRLEDRLGCRLIERTPRHVELSARGAAFLALARELLAVHQRTLATFAEQRDRERIAIGISDHVAGPDLPALIARMNARDPGLVIEIRIGSSGELLQAYDRRELDVAIVRFHADRSDGQVLAEEPFGRWMWGHGWGCRLCRGCRWCCIRGCGVGGGGRLWGCWRRRLGGSAASPANAAGAMVSYTDKCCKANAPAPLVACMQL